MATLAHDRVGVAERAQRDCGAALRTIQAPSLAASAGPESGGVPALMTIPRNCADFLS